jgi:hypothetical protein
MDKMKTSSSRMIDILIVIDTEGIKGSNLHRSTNQGSPTMINDLVFLKNTFFMISSGSRGVVSQGTVDLQINALVNDTVNFRVTSVYGNSDDAVIVYNVSPISGSDNVFGLFTPKVISFNAIQPDPTKYNGMDPITVKQSFSSFSSYIAKTGREQFGISFALYKRDDNTGNQVLFGYYKYDPTIIVG